MAPEAEAEAEAGIEFDEFGFARTVPAAAPETVTTPKDVITPEDTPARPPVRRRKMTDETRGRIVAAVNKLTNNSPLSRKVPRDLIPYEDMMVDVSETDARTIANMLERAVAGIIDKDDAAAVAYFGKYEDPADALLHMAADLRESSKEFTQQQNVVDPPRPGPFAGREIMEKVLDEDGNPVIDPKTKKEFAKAFVEFKEKVDDLSP